jgi:hypothetical protein
MDFMPATAHAHASAIGFDAISMYALPGGSIEVNISLFFIVWANPFN